MAKQRLQAASIEPVLAAALRSRGLSEKRAELCARLFTETSLDGVYSHGLNRFPQFLEMVEKGLVRPDSEPVRVRSHGAIEVWDGRLGPGNLNAWACMGRAVELASENGMGAVSLRRTNHWMRGGTYGLRAARAGCVGICATNTKPNMPPWGGRDASVGNNPFVIAVPHKPYPFLLDMAMSQFSYGRMEVLEKRSKKLPFPGGYDARMKLTDDPKSVLESERALPMGYWKGSGLAMMIDLLVALLSGGQTTREIGLQRDEYGVSQLFLAFDLAQLSDRDHHARIVNQVVRSLEETAPVKKGGKACYPGERSWRRRQKNERRGIPVSRDIWKAIKRAARQGPI